MGDGINLFDLVPDRPALPVPTRVRWQPLRIGLVEMFHYDSEEFWFRDGHLLLRGNNGTGKSKVLSLTLPLLFDAALRPSRVEPDGDPGKKMAWNLLMNSHDRRIGYSWIEFGRLADDGLPRYLTLGVGLYAAAARSEVDAWFFLLEESPAGTRIGQDLWLVNANRVVLTRERLREVIEGHGQVFDTAATYRRAVDERLFRLGTKRYAALMDTLIQLRQPQLSRKPNEAALSDALTEALPPLPSELLGDVAEALNQLDEDHRQLDEFQQLAKAVEQFDRGYRLYAGAQTRRQAHALRQAQTDFDNASRERNEAHERLDQARVAEVEAEVAHAQADLAMTGARARLETLQSDPTMQDANRLSAADADLEAREKASRKAEADHAQARGRQEREEAASKVGVARLELAEHGLNDARSLCAEIAGAAGVAAGFSGHPLASLSPVELPKMTDRDFKAAQTELRALVAARRDQIVVIRRRRSALEKAETLAAQKLDVLREKREAAVAATQRRAEADAAFEDEGRALVEAWEVHFAGLKQLRCEAAAPLAALADWVAGAEGDNPAREVLLTAQQDSSLRLASRQLELERQEAAVRQERADLEAERDRLEAGEDAVPPVPYTRGADTRRGRPGAPLWQLIDFLEQADTAARAGLEAALEASGLLDAWVSPDGALVTADGTSLWQDSQVVPRPPAPAPSLAGWMRAAVPPDVPVPASMVDRLLAGIACGDADPADAEAWISPTGRFRLGGLTGAWAKPQPAFIGFAARAAARARRLDEIASRLAALGELETALQNQGNLLREAFRQAEQEWREAPSDEALRQAQLDARAAASAYGLAVERRDKADDEYGIAERAAREARDNLEWDAADSLLPATADGLDQVERILYRLNDALHHLVAAIQEWRRAWPEHERQQEREGEAREHANACAEQVATCRTEARAAHDRFETLRDAVGAKVETLRSQLEDAHKAVRICDEALRNASEARRLAGEARAVAGTKAEGAATILNERTAARVEAVAKLQQFANSTLLSAALPTLVLPDTSVPWTIDPALTVARRAEQALATVVKDDDDTWARVQKDTNGDLVELHRALGTLGHQALAETSDFGLVVHIVYQNRPERPDQLAARLADEIAQRRELLTAREREVLENHLQAEIATEVQRLLQAAQAQVENINAELHKRPTSTGVRYRLQWQPLGEDEGAPVGLAAARQKLLNASADLWTAEERRVVGAMLQSRIAAERERADAGLDRHEGGSLVDLLARALDYRHWHRFRVQRFQDGQWRQLSGPASSGERALGLTVPLFAAVASFYSQSGHEHAPRLMLLDEAFAGIDDAARAHCMGLIREFDLDFVITSEREWACYAELPGVAICQLQRREGIDAVYVSRWTWDGRAKRRDEDPDRRFPLP